MIELLAEDYEIHIYGCAKLNHKFHVVLMRNNEEIKNIKCMTIGYGMGIIEEYLLSLSAKPEQSTHSCDIMECDPEGMKPKSKYEKAFRVVK